MSEQTTSPNQPSWLEKLTQALLGEPRDVEQLLTILRDANQRELITSDDFSMIEAILQFSQLQARDIMIPRGQMVTVNVHDDLSELLPKVLQSGHSRFPVMGTDRDEVVGILHAKNLLRVLDDQSNKFDLKDYVRPTVVVPESKRLNVLLKEFRINRNHLAIVVDEYGAVAGFITIEDILEQIVGEIEDEFDIDEDANIKKHSEERFVLKATTPIDEVNEYFGCDYPTDSFDTIGGYVSHCLGHLPKRNERVKIGEFEFKILLADTRRIRLLQANRRSD